MSWEVKYSKKSVKQLKEMPESVSLKLDALEYEIRILGPIRGNWKNYAKLSETAHHCHLKSGRPTYVVCWEVIDRTVKIVEIYYVGTHEKAPY